MATTINSTNLDFNSIKNNLKTFFSQQSEFEDYDFEASGLSNLLDVLAYNTHYNALTANFALNESFLNTAQLRASVISLAEGIGYIPRSKTSSRGTVTLSLNLSTGSNLPATISVGAGIKFTSSVDDVTYTFQTRETVTASNNGSGLYSFSTADGSTNIDVFEGTQKTKVFTADKADQNASYVIPDPNLDIATVIVRVYESSSATAFVTYKNIKDATVINDDTTLYILKESPNGFFELQFGDGVTLGKAPEAGYKIEVDYLSVTGAAANRASVFTPTSTYTHESTSYNYTPVTVTNSLGGAALEDIESIRKNAPFQYATQNRMVTAADYSSLILRNFSTLIKDIQSFGGEDALSPKFGTVFVSIVFNDDVTASTQTTTKESITDLVKQLAVLSFSLEFIDPVKTFIETNTFFQFNPRLTTLSQNTISNSVSTAVDNYFTANTGKFNQSFRRSNVLTLVDDVSPAVLSSRMEIKMNQRVIPNLDKLNDISVRFPVSIAPNDDVNTIITSSDFTIGTKTCTIKNKLSSNKLQAINVADQSVVVDNIGEYDATAGTISITGLRPSSIIGGVNFIKLKAVPANASAIAPLRQDVIEHDTADSFVTVVNVTTT